MLDIKFVRNNPEVVKQNIKNKFQDDKLPLVDEVIELDQRNREIKQEVEALRADKNQISKQIGACMAQGKKEEAEELKKKVQENAERVEALSKEEKEVEAKIKQNMMIIPNIIDPLPAAPGGFFGCGFFCASFHERTGLLFYYQTGKRSNLSLSV